MAHATIVQGGSVSLQKVKEAETTKSLGKERAGWEDWQDREMPAAFLESADWRQVLQATLSPCD